MAQSRSNNTTLLSEQERESAAGPGGELRAGPDLHHREDHLRLLPQQRGGAELRRQPAGGRLHAALQTRTQLSGTSLSDFYQEQSKLTVKRSEAKRENIGAALIS